MQAPPRPRSLRWRLAIGQALLMVAVLAAFAALLHVGAQRHLLAQLDRHLHIDAETAQLSLAWDGTAMGWRAIQHGDADAFDTEPFVEVFTPEGVLLFRRVPRGAEPALELPRFNPRQAGSRSVALGAMGWRVGVERFAVAGWPGSLWLRVARSEAPMRAELAVLTRALVAASGVLAMLAAGLSAWLVGRALSPLAALTAQMQRVGAAPGRERVAVPAGTSEPALLAQEFNAMLDRLEASYAQIERFAGDCAHALRTPLTALRLCGEQSLAQTHDPAARSAIGELLEQADRLGLRINRLLLLARAEQRPGGGAAEVVDLAALATSTVHLLAPLAAQHRLALYAEARPAWARGDGLWLQQVLQDLVHNAIVHAGSGGEAVVACGSDPADSGWVWLEVRDRGPGLDAAAATPGAGNSGGAGRGGIGLTMASRLAAVQGGRLELLPRAGGGTVARLLLRATAPGDAAASESPRVDAEQGQWEGPGRATAGDRPASARVGSPPSTTADDGGGSTG